MGCIFAGKGIKTRFSTFTLCGKKVGVQDVTDFFTGKITCATCLIRQDAMFERGYEQQNYIVWYNKLGRYNMVTMEEYNSHEFRIWRLTIPNIAFRKENVLMWDVDTLKNVIKLGKLGSHNMGVTK